MRPISKACSIIALTLSVVFCAGEAAASWVWSPDLGKWMNPKKASKDTPEDQFNWAMTFYESKDWDRALEEFDKLPAFYPNSRLSAEAVYYRGLCFEEKEDYAKAADAYQRLIDSYPYSDRIKDAVRREFDIAAKFASGDKMKVLGVPVLDGKQKALELYQHIVKNAPFGSYGPEAQFNIGEVHRSMGDYEEARKAYQAVIDEYPNSELVTKAKYQIAYSAMLASRHLQYNDQLTEKAIQEFEGFKQSFPQDAQAVEADESIKLLRAKKAQETLSVAEFYEKRNRIPSAKVYYQEVIDRFPETPAAAEAQKRIERHTGGQSSKAQPAVEAEAKPRRFLFW